MYNSFDHCVELLSSEIPSLIAPPPHRGSFSFISRNFSTECYIAVLSKGSLPFVLQSPEGAGTPPSISLKEEPVCLPGQTGLLQCVHGPIMCRQTKAEALSKSLMQNLCSCGCFSGWKNQYRGPDARR